MSNAHAVYSPLTNESSLISPPVLSTSDGRSKSKSSLMSRSTKSSQSTVNLAKPVAPTMD